MGLEAECVARHGDRVGQGKARLETNDLTFRGAFKLSIPLAEVRSARAEGGELKVDVAGGSAVFELGAAAERWARAITQPKSRADKLGVKAGQRVAILGVGDASLAEDLRAGDVAPVEEGAAGKGAMDVVFFGAETRAALVRLPDARRLLRDDGALWVVRPKGREEITEAEVMAAGKRAGLVDVKVVSFSATHTAEKFVIPVGERGAKPKAAGRAGAGTPAAAKAKPAKKASPARAKW